MQKNRPPMPYYMVYPIPEENTNISGQNSDREYFRQLYPQQVKRYIRVIVEVLDRMDVRDSYIYDEYPDKVALDRLSDTILRLIPLEKNMSREAQHNLIKVLISEEIIQRRNNGRNGINTNFP